MWEPGWEERAKLKLTGTVLLSSFGSIISSRRQRASIRANLPLHVAGYSGIMGLFTGIQETLRGVRAKHDAINSFVAGTLAGGLAAGYFQGPKYRVLGALVWGPMCSIVHLANDAFKPRHIIENFLVSEGLLNPVVVERRLQQEAADAERAPHAALAGSREVPRPTQEEVERIRRREMALLLVQRAQAQQPATSGQGPLNSSSESGSAYSRGPTLNSSSSDNSSSVHAEEGGACSTSSSSGRTGDGSGDGKRGWWAWLIGRGRQKGATDQSSGGQGSIRAEQGSGEGGQVDDDDSGFKEWLGSQTLSKDGLVVPASG